MTWLKENKDKWWFLPLVGGAFSLLASVSTIYLNNYFTGKRDRINHERSTYSVARTTALTGFQDTAFELETLGALYVDTFDKPYEAQTSSRIELLTNLSEQIVVAEKLEPFSNNPSAIEKYMDAVILLRLEVDKERPLEDAEGFWDATQKVLIVRKNVIEQENKRP